MQKENTKSGRGNLAKRIGMSFFGVIVCAISVGIFMLAGGKASAIPTIAGIGTIITAFFMGPLIEFFNVHIARPFLAEKKSTGS